MKTIRYNATHAHVKLLTREDLERVGLNDLGFLDESDDLLSFSVSPLHYPAPQERAVTNEVATWLVDNDDFTLVEDAPIVVADRDDTGTSEADVSPEATGDTGNEETAKAVGATGAKPTGSTGKATAKAAGGS